MHADTFNRPSKAPDYQWLIEVAPVVKVRGARWGGAQPLLLPFEPPYNSMSPLIESIKCYFMPK